MLVVLALACSVAIVSSIEPISTIIIGAKILIAKGFIIGAAKGLIARNLSQRGGGHGHGHGKREAEAGDFNAVLVDNYKKDADDCTKFLICQLNAKPLNKLDEDEFAIATTFGQADVLDVTSASVLYDVAAHVGRMAGEKQCRAVYPRCAADVDTIMKEIKKAAYGN